MTVIFEKNRVVNDRLFGYNEKTKEIKKTLEVVSDPILFLGNNIQIANNFTFGDFMLFVEKYKSILERVFSGYLGEHKLKKYIDEIKKDVQYKPYKGEQKIDYLELCWVIDISMKKYRDRPDYIYIYPSFHGINKKEKGGIAIEFSPLYKLKNLPIKINENFEFNVGLNTKIKRIREFTLYDFIRSVFYEISFLGYPADREKHRGRLQKLLDDYKNSEKGKK